MLIILFVANKYFNHSKIEQTNELTATVLSVNSTYITVQDENNLIYTFRANDLRPNIGDKVIIEYAGLLNKNKEIQNNNIISCVVNTRQDDEEFPSEWADNGIFSTYYILAYNYLKKMSLDEKIGQLLLVRYPDDNAIENLKKYKFGGYIFYEKDFQGKSEKQVKNMMSDLQKAANVPILTAVDEEGGRVVRVSSNSNLVSSKFKSPMELYNSGGFESIKNDTIEKSKILSNLGINLNLAPVVDVSTNVDDYIYDRTIGGNTEITSKYAKTVIEASKSGNVSYTLKHFPGYGNNSDTHGGASVDSRSLEDIKKIDLPPFKAGIDSLAEAVLVSHNTVTSMDSSNPASLSPTVHNLLRNDLGFTGIVMTDDLAMDAVSSIDNVAVKALLAGNDIIITTDYEKSISDIKNALNNGSISEYIINKLAFRVIAWKYYKGLMFNTK